MKKLLATLVLGIVSSVSFGQSQVYVNGYFRTDGTYVQSHYRTAPNHTINDNWSTFPNVNPYTGEVGTIIPDYSYNTYTTPTYTTPTYYNNSSDIFDEILLNNYSDFSTPSYNYDVNFDYDFNSIFEL